jgi:hypothetical protein
MQELSTQDLALAVVIAAVDRRLRSTKPDTDVSIASECLYLLHDPRLAPTLIWLDHDQPRTLNDEQIALSEETKALFRRLARVVERLKL